MVKSIWRNFDFLLFGTVVILSLFGIVMIQSAIAGNIDLSGYVNRQVTFVLIGIAVIILFALINYQYWASITKLMYVFAVGFLVVIFIVGEARFGSARWFETGLFSIQPSELAKIILVLVMADYFAKSWEQPKDFNWVFRSFVLMMGVVVWIILQPNLSTSIVIMSCGSHFCGSAVCRQNTDLVCSDRHCCWLVFFPFVMEDYQKTG